MSKNKMQLKTGDILSIPNEGKCVIENVHENGNSKFIEFKRLDNNETLIRSSKFLTNEIFEREQVKLHAPIIFDTYSETYWFSVGFLAMYSTIELRVTPSTLKIVPDEYFLVTKCVADGKYVAYNPNIGTYADNASITFRRPTDEVFKALDFPENEVGNTMLQTSKNRYIIYNKDFIWTLFSIGFRTGSNHDVNRMRAYLKNYSAEYTQAFNKGYLS
jgi:hypothetical protein